LVGTVGDMPIYCSRVWPWQATQGTQMTSLQKLPTVVLEKG